ncbi:MAG: hypothetical protein GY807_03675, partial [Gammaproteobacteria bacterium]|nr:hypothetical protein [Gammaproteobacteria bacterium]
LVDEYAEMMQAGVEFDAAQGVRDENGQVYVWDGLHRGEAAKIVGVLLPVDIRSGTKQDAEWLALTANQRHGLRRSRADKRRVVRLALKHPNGASLSNREIARHCGVNDKTVGKIRRELEVTAEIPQLDKRTVTKADGRTYKIDTRNIGSNELNEAKKEMLPKDEPVSRVQPADTHFTDNKLVITLPDQDNTELALSTSSENSYMVERQSHPCPRCGQDRIVGVNGSKRWCIGCEATWKKEGDFLTEVTDRSGTPALRTLVQRRFLELLSHLDKAQLGQVEMWLDDLEQNLPQPNAAAAAMN